MTFSTAMNSTLTRIAMLTGTRSVTTFTSSLETVRLSSEHLQVPNSLVLVEEVSFRYMPEGASTVTVVWEFDNQGTHSLTFTQNPFTYPVVGSTSTNTTFVLADSANDTTASDMPRPQDTYTQYLPVNGQGKTFEFTISASGQNDFRPLGFEIKARVAGRQAAYVGGIY